MIIGDLIGTPAHGGPLTDAARKLTTTARAAAAVGALFALLGGLSLTLTVLRHGLSVDAVLGGGALVVGGGLWVVAQSFVARWVTDRRPQSLLAALMWGVVAVLTASIGWGMVVGFSWIPAGVAAVVVLTEWTLVLTVDPIWRSRGQRADDVEPVAEMDEALGLRWLALVALSLGVGAGVAVTVQFGYYVLNWQEDWNLIGAFGSVYFFAVVGAWCAPQLALLAWAGGRVRSGVPVIVLGAAVWAALIWAVSGVEDLAILVPLLVGAVLVLEVVVGCMLLWRRFT